MNDLKGKLVLVTGASSGIGASVALEAAGKGAHVILVARNEKRLKEVAARIKETGAAAHVFPSDLADTRGVDKMTAWVQRTIGTPHVLVNNAGGGEWLYLDETSPEDCRQMMTLPALAAMQITRAFLPDMRARKQGHIVNITSVGGFMAWPGATAYTVARWAMRGFSEALSVDLARSGVSVTLAVFAKVNTPYFTSHPGSEERIPKAQKMMRVLTAKEAGRTVIKGILRGRSLVAAPFMLRLVLFQARCFPGATRRLMQMTGHRRAA
jgi:short-subunit dehydrogenase